MRNKIKQMIKLLSCSEAFTFDVYILNICLTLLNESGEDAILNALDSHMDACGNNHAAFQTFLSIKEGLMPDTN
jgi:hypothetical protein